MKSSLVTFTLNGEEQELLVEPGRRLVDVLRDQCGATGTKNGCSQGTCGACTIHVDGRAVFSCLLPAELAEGADILTIEGLAEGRTLHALQDAFVTHAAIQCGFCTAGMIMAAKALLDADPDPDRDAVIEAISGNVCRCTGYEPIVDAILDAARTLAARPAQAA
jgi:aerobic carbon-monoxide dehydrogenase small subunit